MLGIGYGSTKTRPELGEGAVQEALDGKAVEWMQHVSDAKYQSEEPAF